MKYQVCINRIASTWEEVEADSKEEAIDLALRNSCVSLCHQCSHEMDLSDPDHWQIYTEDEEFIEEGSC